MTLMTTPGTRPDPTRLLGELEALVANRTAQLEQAMQRLEEDIRKREAAEAELLRRNNELTELNARLSMAQEQLMQSEKLASIGQLAAGVAHEINNPIGYVFSNFETLGSYIGHMLTMFEHYRQAEASIAAPEVLAALRVLRTTVDLDFLIEDIPVLMAESREGAQNCAGPQGLLAHRRQPGMAVGQPALGDRFDTEYRQQ